MPRATHYEPRAHAGPRRDAPTLPHTSPSLQGYVAGFFAYENFFGEGHMDSLMDDETLERKGFARRAPRLALEPRTAPRGSSLRSHAATAPRGPPSACTRSVPSSLPSASASLASPPEESSADSSHAPVSHATAAGNRIADDVKLHGKKELKAVGSLVMLGSRKNLVVADRHIENLHGAEKRGAAHASGLAALAFSARKVRLDHDSNRTVQQIRSDSVNLPS